MIAPAPESAIVSPLAATSATARSKFTAALPVLLRLALIAPLVLLTHCAGKGYKAASYSAAKLATPSHNMSQRDYPFDSKGNYRKEWVKSGSTRPGSANVGSKKSSSRSSSSTVAANTRTAPAPAPAPTRSSSSSRTPSTISPPRTTVPATRSSVTSTSTTTYRPAPAPAPKPKPKPKPTSSPTRYHKVEAKQTLWAISQKYGVTVDALQRANGISGTLIRPGQSLRIP